MKDAEEARKLTSLPEDDRPREKLSKQGVKALSNSDLLALIIRAGTRGKNAVDVCQHILSDLGLRELARADIDQLTGYEGIGEVKAGQILAAFELAKRWERAELDSGQKVKSIDEVLDYLLPQMRDLEREELRLLHVSNAGELLKEETLFQGSLDEMLVAPREVAKACLKQNSKALILAHNHPNGEPDPTEEDLLCTEEIKSVLDPLDVELLDHIVVGRRSAVSLREEGYI